jgi:hypothetical protein
MAGTLTSWFEVYELVAEKGLAGMYDHYEEQRRREAERQRDEFQRRQKSPR